MNYSRVPSGREESRPGPDTVTEQQQQQQLLLPPSPPQSSRIVQVPAAASPVLENGQGQGQWQVQHELVRDSSSNPVPLFSSSRGVGANGGLRPDTSSDNLEHSSSCSRRNNNEVDASGSQSQSQSLLLTTATAVSVSAPSLEENVANTTTIPRRLSPTPTAVVSISQTKSELESPCDFGSTNDESINKPTEVMDKEAAVPLGPETQKRNVSPSPRQGKSEPCIESSVSGQKRTAAGDIKPASHSPVVAPPSSTNTTGSGRHRSRTIDSASHGSRIAELSVHLRARLSYAAAQVERSWQSRGLYGKIPVRLMQSASAFQQTSSVVDGSDSTRMMTDRWKSPRLLDNNNETNDNGSPGGGNNNNTVSAPGSPASPSHLQPPDISITSTAPMSPPTRISSSYPSGWQPTLRTSRSSPVDLLHMSRFGPPPAVSDGGYQSRQRRRRPNPNEPIMLRPPSYGPSPRHQRHYSQQEPLVSNSQTVLVPGTSPLGSSALALGTTSSLLHQRQTRSRNASMEQDAIETLLFMSSPENSGYHTLPNSLPSNSQNIPTSIDSSNSIGDTTGSSAPGSQQTQQSSQQSSQRSQTALFTAGSGGKGDGFLGLEAQAGDEIDRMLDQMDDSDDDERGFALYNFNSLNTGSIPAHPCSGDSGRDGGVLWKRRGI